MVRSPWLVRMVAVYCLAGSMAMAGGLAHCLDGPAASPPALAAAVGTAVRAGTVGRAVGRAEAPGDAQAPPSSSAPKTRTTWLRTIDLPREALGPRLAECRTAREPQATGGATGMLRAS